MSRLIFINILLVLACAACRPVSATPTATSTAPSTATSTATPAAAATTPTVAAQATVRRAVIKLPSEHKTLTSAALAGNLLGDPTERGFTVMLPSDYADSDKRYPVVYVLHGYTGHEFSISSDFRAAQTAALKKGAVQEMIFVFPNAHNQLGGSMYLSSPTIGDYETYLAQELVAYIDANYRTIPDRDSRGIVGCSMGADGALHLAFKYPDVYSVAAPYSGLYDWTRDPWLALGAEEFTAEPTSFDEFFRLPITVRGEIATAAAVAPNGAKPPFFLDMPYVVVDDHVELASGFVDKLAAASPMQDAKHYLQQPLRLRGILLLHGENDNEVPVALAQGFSAYLTELGIEHEYLQSKGSHCAMSLKPLLQFMSDHLVFAEPAQ